MLKPTKSALFGAPENVDIFCANQFASFSFMPPVLNKERSDIVTHRWFLTEQEVEKLVPVAGNKNVIVVQKRHVPTGQRWITVVGYVLQQTEHNHQLAYVVQPIVRETEIELLWPLIEADITLEKKLDLFPNWQRYTRPFSL